MSPNNPPAPGDHVSLNLAEGHQLPPPATVLRVSEGLRRVFGSPEYTPPLLPSVAVEIHGLSCRPDIEINRLIHVLESDPLLASHVLKVANSPIFCGREPETSLRSALLRLGLKNLGEIVLELALHMRVFRSAEYSGIMEQLRRHSAACANLCRLLAARTGQDPENAFLCGLLHDIGIAAVLIVLGEKQKSGSDLDASVLDEVVGQTHEDVSGMLARLWKLPADVVDVVAHHHGQAAVDAAPVLSAVVMVADNLAAKLKFTVDFGGSASDGTDSEAFAAACTKLNLSEEAVAGVEREALPILRRVDETLKHQSSVVDAPTEAASNDAGASETRGELRRSQVRPILSPAARTPGSVARAWRALAGIFR